MVLVSIFGTNLSTNDILTGLMMLSAPIIIVLCCFIARTGRVDIVFGVLFLLVIVLCIGGASR